jgi:hypothetical protein
MRLYDFSLLTLGVFETMRKNKNSKSSKAKAAEASQPSSALTGGVFTAASLKREAQPDAYRNSGVYYVGYMSEIYLDRCGNLCGQAGCGDTAFICTKAEIPQLAAFLNSLAVAA